MSSYSIHSRLLVAASVVLALFLGLSGIALNRAFLNSVEQATEERLMGHVYAILGAAETDPQGRMRIPEVLPDPRFSRIDSGLYAAVSSGRGDSYQWRSHSLTGRQLPQQTIQTPGQPFFGHNRSKKRGYYLLSYSLTWEDDMGVELTYHMTIGEDEGVLLTQVATFRERLWFWLGGAAILLLLVQGGVLAWGLRPLRRVSADLERVQEGSEVRLTGRYPKELKGLTKSVNSLIQSNFDSRERYRNSLGDLAHSLKTPLAVLQGVKDSSLDELKSTLSEQIPRMDEIVQYQLKRAAAGGQPMGVAASVSQVVTRLVSTLNKVYQDKALVCQHQQDDAALFLGDDGDLMELLGNIIENGYKYCKSQVLITVIADYPLLRITVEDDGDGIMPETDKHILRRGIRRDQTSPGQGIGLSVARDIIELYRGQLLINRSSLGGAEMVILLPSKRVV